MAFHRPTIPPLHFPTNKSGSRKISPRTLARNFRVIDDPINPASLLDVISRESIVDIDKMLLESLPTTGRGVYLLSPINAWESSPRIPVPRYRDPEESSPSPCPKGKVPVLRLKSLHDDPTQQRWVRRCVKAEKVNKKRERRERELIEKEREKQAEDKKRERRERELIEKEREKQAEMEEQRVLTSINECLNRVDEFMIVVEWYRRDFETKKASLQREKQAEMEKENKKKHSTSVREMMSAKDNFKKNLKTADNTLKGCDNKFQTLSKTPRLDRGPVKERMSNLRKTIDTFNKLIAKEEKLIGEKIEREARLKLRGSSRSVTKPKRKTDSKLRRRIGAAKAYSFDYANEAFNRPPSVSSVEDGDLVEEELLTPKEEYGYSKEQDVSDSDIERQLQENEEAIAWW